MSTFPEAAAHPSSVLQPSTLFGLLTTPITIHTTPLSLLVRSLIIALSLSTGFSPLRTLLLQTGTSPLASALILAPGLLADPLPRDVEYPATAAMTTGYVFRTENVATVAFFLRVAEVGCLTRVRVSSLQSSARGQRSSSLFGLSTVTSVILGLAISITFAAVAFVLGVEDYWALASLLLLFLGRLLGVLLFQRLTGGGWHGKLEPGVEGDLLVLLSRDRWIRVTGLVDDLKAVTSGAWLKDMSLLENALNVVAKIVVYAGVLVGVVGAGQKGVAAIVGVLVVEGFVLVMGNRLLGKDRMVMHGRELRVDRGALRRYERRLDMAKELIEEHARDDWAIGLGMIVPEREKVEKATM